MRLVQYSVRRLAKIARSVNVCLRHVQVDAARATRGVRV